MRRLLSNARLAATLAAALALIATGVVGGATGGTFVLGVPNTASTQTALNATTSANGALVQNLGTGNGGVFVSNSATGIAGVTRQASRFALAGTNDGSVFHPAGGAVSASGKQNHGLNASTQNIAADAVRGVNGSTTGTPSDTTFANGVYGESRYGAGNGVLGFAAAASGEGWGVWGATASADGVGVVGSNDGGGFAGLFFGDVEVAGDVYANNLVTPTAATVARNVGAALAPGDPVTLAGVEEADGRFVMLVRRAAEGERVVGVADGAVTLVASTREAGATTLRRGSASAPSGAHLVVVTRGLYAMPAVPTGEIGTPLAVGSGGRVTDVAEGSPAAGSVIGVVAGTAADGRVLVFIDPG
jgi:hypothetical protein